MLSHSDEVTVLIVDDDANFHEGLKRLFYAMRRDISVRLLHAACGEDAIAALSREPVDCMLLDYQMHGGDGLYWLSEIRKGAPESPVIMVTGVGSERVAVEAMKGGAQDYLVKGSITPESLLRAVRNALQHVQMSRTIHRQQEELLEAERQRVMIESLGAACHHIGQPFTVIRTYLELMRRKETSPELQSMIAECATAADEVADILNRLRIVSCFRSTSYLPLRPNESPRPDERILDV